MSAALCLALSLSIWCAPTPDDSVSKQVQQIYDEIDYQRELPIPREQDASPRATGSHGHATPERDPGGNHEPRPGEPQPNEEHAWSRPWPHLEGRDARKRKGLPGEIGPRRKRPEPREPGPDLSGLESILEILMYVVAAVVVLAAIVYVLRNWGRRERVIESSGERARPRVSLEGPRAEADALAAQGLYDQAVHVLLLRTIHALAAAHDHVVPDAWTSRDIQREAEMPESARKAFGVLVDVVERSLFGGRSVAEQEWRACRECFDGFESAYQKAGR